MRDRAAVGLTFAGIEEKKFPFLNRALREEPDNNRGPVFRPQVVRVRRLHPQADQDPERKTRKNTKKIFPVFGKSLS
ncbi:hypothetical protein DLM77_12645 [Leptospira yasudae]|uniref:Uncharacterized protein n=1 Tax=Leptospira yasudae TaxID=2202201 RepID=A0ABX9M3P4_9LEPT|nr:hypothetical protein DLM77_12645 [Leptospira yasudae]